MRRYRLVLAILLLLLVVLLVDSIRLLDWILVVLSAVAAGLTLWVLLARRDPKLILRRNRILRRYASIDLEHHFVLFVQLKELSTYHPYYDLTLSDHIVLEAVRLLKAEYSDVFLYAPDQIVLVVPFVYRTVINQKLRTEEQERHARHIQRVLTSHAYQRDAHGMSYRIRCVIASGSAGIRGDNVQIRDMVRLAHFTLLRAIEQKKEILVANEEIRHIKADVDTFHAELERGLELDEIVPYYLPVIDVQTMNLIGCEVLLRWEQGDYRIIEAGRFKQVAEEKNLFEKLDRIILHKALHHFALWRSDDLISDTFVITFNLNRNTLERLIVTDLIRLVETHDIPPFLVEFDISDQDVTHPHVIRTLSQLKDHGFRVSLDVFRTDAITLGALSHVPLHTIKLDRSFLPSGIDQAPQDDIYRTITRLSRVFSQRLMAKGIENRHQLEWIRQLGIDSFQGYYITPPLNDFRIRGFLNKYHDTPLV